MKIICEAKPFAQALQFAGRVIQAKPVWPIMTNIKIVANDTSLTLIGTNGDTTLEMDAAATVLTSGVICVPFDPLVKFVAAAKGGTVEIEQTAHSVVVKSGRGRIVLSGVSVDEFPIYKPQEGAPAVIDGPSLCSALRFCLPAVADDEVRYYLKGVCLREGGGVEFWATNGHAMHMAMMPDLQTVGGGGIIPTDAVGVILSVSEKQDLVHLLVTDIGWHVVAGPVRAFGKVIDGTYPDCARVVASFKAGMSDVASLPKDDLAAAITVASIGADAGANKSRSMILRGIEGQPIIARGFKGIDGVLQAGRAETDARASATFSGVVNAAFLNAAITTMGAADIVLAYSEQGAFHVRPAQDSATMQMFAIVMGIRASEEEMADAA